MIQKVITFRVKTIGKIIIITVIIINLNWEQIIIIRPFILVIPWYYYLNYYSYYFLITIIIKDALIIPTYFWDQIPYFIKIMASKYFEKHLIEIIIVNLDFNITTIINSLNIN